MTVRRREKCVTASRREIDFARTSYHSPRKAAVAAASLFSSPDPPSPFRRELLLLEGCLRRLFADWRLERFEKRVRGQSLSERIALLSLLSPPSPSLSLFRARARFWRNCFFVLAFPPFDPRFPDSSSFPSFYPSPVCPIAIVRDESRVEKKKRKEKEGGKIFKCSLVRSLVILVVCLYVVIIVLPREGV